jgi:hypothetical protein
LETDGKQETQQKSEGKGAKSTGIMANHTNVGIRGYKMNSCCLVRRFRFVSLQFNHDACAEPPTFSTGCTQLEENEKN